MDWKKVFAGLSGTAGVGLVAIAHSLAGIDLNALTSNPVVLALLGTVLAGANWLIGKLVAKLG